MAINPEKEFKTTPELKSKSTIVSVNNVDYRKGIILNSPEEFAQALVVYNGGSVPGAGATQKNLMEGVGNEGSGMGAILVALGGAKTAQGFIGRLTQEALAELQSGGRFIRSFDYDAGGTNFFKTTVEGNRVGDKYVLELCAAYVGSEPEVGLAHTLGKPMALTSSSVKGQLSVVDDWWFNVNLDDVLQGLPISRMDMAQCAQYIVHSGFQGVRPETEFKHEGQKFILSFNLNAEIYSKSEGGEYYVQARGSSIVGGSWTTVDETGHKRVAPRVIPPSIVVSVSMPGERYFRPPAVTEEQMKALQNARDYLAGVLAPNK